MKTNQDKGFIVGSLLVLIIVISTLLLTITSSAISNYQSASSTNARTNAQLASDSGLDQGLFELNVDDTWVGTSGEMELLNDGDIRTTYDVAVSDISSTRKSITSVGRAYEPASSTVPKATRIFELEAEAVTSGSTGSGVVSGVGGLYMNNNSKITGGDVVVGGVIHMDNQAQIGLSYTPAANAVNVRVAHYDCPSPADATFPRLCASGENDEPILMKNNAKIYADVKANNQVTTTDISNPGLTANSGVAQTTVPSYVRSTHPVGGGTYAASDPTVSCPNNNGSVVWPADVKITGDFDMKNNCTVTLLGNAWVTGNFTTGNQGKIVVSDAVAGVSPVIMIDGQSGFRLANNGRVFPNSFGSGIEVRTFWSQAACSPECTDVTGSDLDDSQDVVTIDLGNNGQAQNSVFIAQWSRVQVSNNGLLGAVSGQSIELTNQAVINFTASVPGSDNLTTTWVKRGYLRIFQ